MGQVPSAWNALPPLLHLANSYSSVKTQLERPLLQEAFPDFSGFASVLPCPVPLFLSQQPTCSLRLPLFESVAPTDCEPLEGRDQHHVPVCAQRCTHLALSGCGECLVNEQCG